MKKYVTIRLNPEYKQMSFEDLLFNEDYKPCLINDNKSNTRTYEVDDINPKIWGKTNVYEMIMKLTNFNNEFGYLKEKSFNELYTTFHIPKRSGGLRRIDAPKEELMHALRCLKEIFEIDFKALYHTSAFAYVKNRSTVDAVKRHQSNKSKWFAKFDLSDFFGSTTLDFVMDMFSKVFPFSEIIERPIGKEALRKALDLAFLYGGLPQGTPVSPIITNIMMIPIDYTISKRLREIDNQSFVYTRYADDFLVSSRRDFNVKKIESLILDVLTSFNAPFKLNKSKTRYGSSAGSNWNLGVMLNKDNEITIGHKKKRQFKAMLSNYIMDKKNNKPWDLSDINSLNGYISYYKMIEKKSIEDIIKHLNEKYNVNVVKMIRKDLRNE